VDIAASANLEIVDKFCYLDDMSVEGGTSASRDENGQMDA